MLRALACCGEDKFADGLKTLEAHIAAYKSKILRNRSEKIKKKREQRDAEIREKYPMLYNSLKTNNP